MRTTYVGLSALVVLTLCLGTGILTISADAEGPWVGDITINSDGSVSPGDAPIKVSKNSYCMTDDIEGTIYVERSKVDLNGKGYSIYGDYIDHGIVLDDVDEVTVKDFNIYSAYDGIHLEGSCENTIKDNSVFDCYNTGIGLWDGSDGNTVKADHLNGNYVALWLEDSDGNMIKENVVTSNYFGLYLYFADENNVKENTIEDQVIWGIVFSYSSNDMATENYIDGGGYYGVGAWGGDGGHQIKENIIKNFCTEEYDWGVGIYIEDISDVVVKENELYDNFLGIGSWYTHDISIDSNYITGTMVPAVYIDTSTTNHVKGNEIVDNTFGIYFWNRDGTLQMENLITYNLIEGNWIGIMTDDMFDGYNYPEDSGGNTIHHNSIIDNDIQVYEGYENIWDDGKGEGNYWSDYEGEDTNYDGVGDTDLPHNGVDYYPLMEPYY